MRTPFRRAAGWLAVWLAAVALMGCGLSLGRDEFFDLDRRTRLQRMEAYPIERQWRLFLYGQQAVHPPDTLLAIPLAKQGRVAADYILEQLTTTENEGDYHESLMVFLFMKRDGYLNVCGDSDYLNRIRANEFKIQRKGSREIYREMLSSLCPTKT